MVLSHATRDGFPRSLSDKRTTIPPTGGDGTTAGNFVDPITFAKNYSTENFALDLFCIEAQTFCKKGCNPRPQDQELSVL